MKTGQAGENQASSAGTFSALTTEVWQHRHVLDLDDFAREEIELVFEASDAMEEVLSRDVRRVPTLRGRTILLMFFEPSTRTRASFELAAKNLSADVVNFSASGSSVVKGESFVVNFCLTGEVIPLWAITFCLP